MANDMKIFSPFLAGICIGIGSWAYLAIGGVAGAVLFSVGLMCVCGWKIDLFTGKAGIIPKDKSLVPMLGFNVIGAVMMAIVMEDLTITNTATSIVNHRLADGWLLCGIKAIGCGFLVHTAVCAMMNGISHLLVLVFCVTAFVVCGMPHCIADATYYALYLHNHFVETDAGIIPCWIATAVGNYIGCNMPKLKDIF